MSLPRLTMGHARGRRAFTLLELLVVIAIITILFSLLAVALTHMRERASVIQCQSNLRNLALAVHAHHTAKGHLPPYASGGASNEIIGSWFVHLMPYLDHQVMYDLLANGQRSTHAGGVSLVVSDGRALPGISGVVFPELLCRSDPTRIATQDAPTNYLANWYAFTNAPKNAHHPAQRFADLADGPGNVVLFAEGYQQCDNLPRPALDSAFYHNFGITQHGKPSDDPSYAPQDFTMFQVRPATCDKWRTQTAHREMQIALADGCVRTVSASISLTTWRNALKPRDGNMLGADW